MTNQTIKKMSFKFFTYRKSLFLLIAGVCISLSLTACSSDDDEQKNDERLDLSFKLSLKNEKGQETNTLNEGENIIFCITVENNNSCINPYDTYYLFKLGHYEQKWYNDNVINVSEMAKSYPDYCPTAFAIYNADKQLVGFPMDKILRKRFDINPKGSVSFECPWFQKEGETVYSEIFEKEQQRMALLAGQYEVCCLSFISVSARDRQTKMQFTVVK